MTRKKKEEKILYCDIENGIMSEGNVKIKVYNNDKLYRTIEKHNSGTIELCRYVRDVIIGKGLSINQPAIIKPCKKSNNGLVPLSNSGWPYADRWAVKEDEDTTSATAIIKFNIPYTILSVDQQIEGFQLFNQKNDKCYAYVNLFDYPIKVQEKTNIEVSWSLKITYSVKQEVTNG